MRFGGPPACAAAATNDAAWLADSITESWRGTSSGRTDCSRCKGIPQVFDKHFGRYRTGVFGISGAPEGFRQTQDGWIDGQTDGCA
jgi:hypothetical protein